MKRFHVGFYSYCKDKNYLNFGFPLFFYSRRFPSLHRREFVLCAGWLWLNVGVYFTVRDKGAKLEEPKKDDYFVKEGQE